MWTSTPHSSYTSLGVSEESDVKLANDPCALDEQMSRIGAHFLWSGEERAVAVVDRQLAVHGGRRVRVHIQRRRKREVAVQLDLSIALPGNQLNNQ